MYSKKKVTSGIKYLDNLLGGGIIIGDNVVWYDDAGRLASVFCLNLVRISQKQKKSLIYICFDHSPKSLIEKLGSLSKNKFLTILDCFTNGKGEGSDIFQEFYKQKNTDGLCQVIKVDEPFNIDHVTGAFYKLHKTMKDDVRFVFDSLTGMQELWGGEDQILKFYSHACPRLYELNTIAYWIIEKKIHSEKFKAHINKITQVAIELSIKRGKTFLKILKADKRDLDIINKSHNYWNTDIDVTFEFEKSTTQRQIDLGIRIKKLRIKQGLSQSELSKLVGVTASTISQIENNQIYPSLQALIKISEILSVNISSFFQNSINTSRQVVFQASESIDVQLPAIPKGSIAAKLLVTADFESRAEPYLIEIPPGTKLFSHFFNYKGEEIGYLLSGELKLTLEKGVHTVIAGDLIYLTSEMPSKWENSGPIGAKLLWLNVK